MSCSKRIMLVFGTRPEAVKMCPLILELRKRESLEVIVTVTAQHRQMLNQVLKAFRIISDFDLNIMKDRQNLFDITTNVMNGMKGILKEVKPDIVLVHGDTTRFSDGQREGFIMKILFTSVGRRVELMQAFRHAAEHLKLPLEIHGADVTRFVPALAYCDRAVIVPRITDD